MAISAAQQALALAEELATADNQLYGPVLVTSLSLYVRCLLEAGGCKEALGPAQRAVDSARSMLGQDDRGGELRLADALVSLSCIQIHVQGPDVAVGAADEAAEIYRKHFYELKRQASDEAYTDIATVRHKLASTLRCSASYLGQFGHFDCAIKRSDEAVELLEQDVREIEDMFGDLSGTLHDRARILIGLSRHEETLKDIESAIDKLGPFFLRSPERHVQRMIMIINLHIELSRFLNHIPDLALLGYIFGRLSRMGLGPAEEAAEMDEVGMATAAVALLAPYVAKGGEALAGKVGGEVGSRIVGLWDLVRGKLKGPAAEEAVKDLEAKPDDQRRQGALEVQLEKALEADPAFRDQVAALLREIEEKGGQPINQIASIVGDHNVSVQTAGSGNTTIVR